MKDGLGNEIRVGDLVTAKLPEANVVCRISHIQQGVVTLLLQLPEDAENECGRLLALKEPSSLITRPN